jgi:tetratricopeptide (TPR) repeat protein
MRAYKIILKSVVALVVLLAIYFFGFTDSYKTSLKAKLKYLEGDYKEANELAKKAFDDDPYNRMAIGVLAQSKISVEFVDYIEDAKIYLKKIDLLTKKEDFSNRDKIKIKMMTEVMLGRYKKLNATVMTDKDLRDEAKKYYKKFKLIDERFFKNEK